MSDFEDVFGADADAVEIINENSHSATDLFNGQDGRRIRLALGAQSTDGLISGVWQSAEHHKSNKL